MKNSLKRLLAAFAAVSLISGAAACSDPNTVSAGDSAAEEEDSDESAAQSYIDRAKKYYKNGDIEKAIRYLKKAEKKGADVDNLLEEYETALAEAPADSTGNADAPVSAATAPTTAESVYYPPEDTATDAADSYPNDNSDTEVTTTAAAYYIDVGDFYEYPVFEDIEAGYLNINCVYTEPLDLTDGQNKSGYDIFFYADISALENSRGFAWGDFVPYLTVDYRLTATDNGEIVSSGTLLPVNMSSGTVYGANVDLRGKGKFLLSLNISDPSQNGVVMHLDEETGPGSDSFGFGTYSLTCEWDYEGGDCGRVEVSEDSSYRAPSSGYRFDSYDYDYSDYDSDYGFWEYPIFEDHEVGFMCVSALYYPAVELSDGYGGSDNDIHLEVDFSAYENKFGYGVGDFIPYLTVDCDISDGEGHYSSYTLRPCIASDGLHYGANLSMPESGIYTITLTIHSPEENGVLLVTDEAAGPGASSFDEAFHGGVLTIQYEWDYVSLI